MLQAFGFHWVSGKYARHPIGELGEEPSTAVFDGIVQSLRESHPFVYPETGLIEIPMSPVSDINAFRNGRWKLEYFLLAIRRAVEWTIENRAVFDFLGHPSCLLVTDPKMQVFDLICNLVRKGGDGAALVDLETIARRVKP